MQTKEIQKFAPGDLVAVIPAGRIEQYTALGASALREGKLVEIYGSPRSPEGTSSYRAPKVIAKVEYTVTRYDTSRPPEQRVVEVEARRIFGRWDEHVAARERNEALAAKHRAERVARIETNQAEADRLNAAQVAAGLTVERRTEGLVPYYEYYVDGSGKLLSHQNVSNRTVVEKLLAGQVTA